MASTPVHAGWAGLPTLGNNAHSVTYTDSVGQVVWSGDSTSSSRRARFSPACAGCPGGGPAAPPQLAPTAAPRESAPPRPDPVLAPPPAVRPLSAACPPPVRFSVPPSCSGRPSTPPRRSPPHTQSPRSQSQSPHTVSLSHPTRSVSVPVTLPQSTGDLSSPHRVNLSPTHPTSVTPPLSPAHSVIPHSQYQFHSPILSPPSQLQSSRTESASFAPHSCSNPFAQHQFHAVCYNSQSQSPPLEIGLSPTHCFSRIHSISVLPTQFQSLPPRINLYPISVPFPCLSSIQCFSVILNHSDIPLSSNISPRPVPVPNISHSRSRYAQIQDTSDTRSLPEHQSPSVSVC